MIGLNVAQLLKEPQGATRRYVVEEDAATLGEPTVVGPVHATCSLLRTGRGVLADCEFDASVTTECGRCVEPTTVPVRGRFQEEFVQTVHVRTGVPIDADTEGETFTIDDQHTLDLGEAIRQHVLIAAPLQALHSPDCQGLCEQCGHNLNEGPCACEPDLEGSPFVQLRQILGDDGDRARRP